MRDLVRLLLDQAAGLAKKNAALDAELRRRVTADDTVRRLTTIPGVGAVTAATFTTFAPPMGTYSKGRDFAAWIGLTPRQHSSGGKDRLGRTSKMGQARRPMKSRPRSRASSCGITWTWPAAGFVDSRLS